MRRRLSKKLCTLRYLKCDNLPVCIAVLCDLKQGTMESILWGYNSGAGARAVPGAAGTSDALPILASRPQLDRFLSSARALELLRPMRDSLRRGGGAADAAALPQWGTGLPGEDRVLDVEHEHNKVLAGRNEEDVSVTRVRHEDEAVGWGY